MYRIHRHVFSSWDVYPRANYFLERINDLHERFTKLMDALPESFNNIEEMKRLKQLRFDLNKGIRITVFGREDIDDEILVCSNGLKNETKEARERDNYVDIVVVNLEQSFLLENDFSMAGDLIEYIESDEMPKFVILNCDTKDSHQNTLIDAFMKKLSLETKIQPRNKITASATLDLQKRISDILEEHIRDGFLKIQVILKRFEPTERNLSEEERNIIKSKAVTEAISNLYDIYGLKDYFMMSKGDVAGILVDKLCAAIRCAAVPLLARKYTQQLWICNTLLYEIKFQEALADSVAKTSRYHLAKIKLVRQTDLANIKGYRSYQDQLKADMKETLKETEKKFLGMERISLVFKKMLFETNGYLKETNIGLSVADSDMLFSPHVNNDLRRQLLSIKEVHGLGTIYGKLEIHVDQEGKDIQKKGVTFDALHDDRNGKSVSDEPRRFLHREIAAVLKINGFYHPYVIKNVQRKASNANRIFEPGKKAMGPCGVKNEMKLGTIGGYVFSRERERKLYVLTCKHVIGENGIIYADNGNTLLAKYHESLDTCFIDIAAVEVDELIQDRCKKYVKCEMQRISQVHVFSEPKNNLKAKRVHKFGAATGLTKGIILTDDYNDDIGNLEYVVIIDQLPMESGNDIVEDLETFSPLQTISNYSDAEKLTVSHAQRNDESHTHTSSEQVIQPTGCGEKNTSAVSIKEEVDILYSRDSSNAKITIFVRDINGKMDPDDNKSCNGSFSDEGDSGAIICTPDPRYKGLEFLAVSMLSGCGLQISGERSQKTVSLMLRHGLDHISKNCNINFL